MLTPPAAFLRLQDVLLAAPLPALLSVFMTSGIAYCGWLLARRVRGGACSAVDSAGGFIVVAGIIAALVHGAALAQWATLATLRPLGLVLASVGMFAIVARWTLFSRICREQLATVTRGPVMERVTAAASIVTVIALGLAALGPVTDADSLDYHLGVPLDWLAHGGAYARDGWFSARLVGIGEALTLLGLATGTDSLGATLQFGGLLALIVSLQSFAEEARDSRLAAVFVLACPTIAFLVPSQKPQMLPTAATTVALSLVVLHFRRFSHADAWIVFACLGFAAACKISFLLSIGFVAIAAIVAAHRAGCLRMALVAAVTAACLFLVPVWARNAAFYGDPLSPLFERLRPDPDLAVRAFADGLRYSSNAHPLVALLRLPWDMVATLSPARFTSLLGVGALATFALRGRFRQDVWLTGPAVGATLACLAFGQLTPRFFFEPYLWMGAACVRAPWNDTKRWIWRGLVAQGVLTAAVALFAAATLFPGALIPGARDAVMHRSAAGYSEAQWLDASLPSSAVVVDDERFRALSPRPFAPADAARFDPNGDERLRVLIESTGANTLLVRESSPPAVHRLASRCGVEMLPPASLRRATRNPFNVTTYELRVYRLEHCR